MSKKRSQSAASPTQKRPAWLLPGIIIAVLAVIAAVVAVLANSSSEPFVAEVTGAPSVEVDQTTIDHGAQPYGNPVESLFRIRNVGDQPLIIASSPQVETVEGC